MPAPLKVRCPSCDGSLTLKDRSALGKKVKCPKCGEPFKLELPDDEEVDVVDDYEDMDDFGDGEDDWDEEESPRSKSRGGKESKGKKSSKNRKGSGNSKTILLILAIAVGVVVLIGGGIFLAMNLGGGGAVVIANKIDLTHLPPNANMVMVVKLAEIEKAPVLSEVVQQFKNQMPAGLPGMNVFNNNSVQQITLGVVLPQNFTDVANTLEPLGKGGNPTTPMIVVAKFAQPLAVEDLSKPPLSANAVMHGTQTYYKNGTPASASNPLNCYYLPDSKTMVCGSETEVKAAIDRGATQTRRADLDFINPRHQFLMAALNQQAGGASAPTPGAPPQLEAIMTEMNKSTRGLMLGVSFSEQVDLEIILDNRDSAGAGNLKAAIDTGLADIKKQYEQSKGMLGLMGMTELIAAGDKATASLAANHSGTTVNVSGTIPSEIKGAISKMQSLMGGMGGPAAPPAGFPVPTSPTM